MIASYYKNKWCVVLILLSFILLSACTTTPQRTIPPVTMQPVNINDDTAAWRRCYFRITWPEDSEPHFEIDLLIAHRIVGPVLINHGNNMYRWRFHRRAGRDEAGHQFTFAFYSGSTHAKNIIQQLQENNVRKRLLEKEILEVAGCDSPEDMSMPGIADTSDKKWSDSVQAHWPSYIMGVSNLWLGLIDDAIATVGGGNTDIDSMIQDYQQASELVTSVWRNEGQHAFLHHLNAVFGYESTLIRY